MKIKRKKIIAVSLLSVIALAAIIVTALLLPGVFGTEKPEKQFEKDTDYITITEFGSAKRLVGKTAFVTIFADDTRNKWDFSKEEDIAWRKRALGLLSDTADWLIKEGEKYGKQLSFIYPEDENSPLYYETAFGKSLFNNFKLYQKYAELEWDYIEKNINVKDIYDKYECDNIVFQFYLNPGGDISYRSMAMATYGREMAKPYELTYFPVSTNMGIAATVIAHETLHLFGTPDLYVEGSLNYNVDKKFIEYVRENCPDDIMFSTFITDEDGNKVRPADGELPKEISEVTAYFLGWLDYTPDWVDEYGLVHNQFEYYDSLEDK